MQCRWIVGLVSQLEQWCCPGDLVVHLVLSCYLEGLVVQLGQCCCLVELVDLVE